MTENNATPEIVRRMAARRLHEDFQMVEVLSWILGAGPVMDEAERERFYVTVLGPLVGLHDEQATTAADVIAVVNDAGGFNINPEWLRTFMQAGDAEAAVIEAERLLEDDHDAQG